MKTIAFIGVGVMGQSMIRNLMRHGYTLRVYTRTKSKADAVVKEGALWCDSVADCVDGADAVITIVGYPKDVEEVYFGPNGIIENAKPGAYLIDMTTTSPNLSVRIDELATEKGLFALDAPVSGGDVGAKNATLSIMVGGDPEAFEACKPIFACMGKNIVHTGTAGNGQHTKMANQIALAGAIAGVCEAITYARSVGLDVENMLACIGGGAAGSWQIANMAPRALQGDVAPGFFVKHFVKDMDIVAEECMERGFSLSMLETVRRLYQEMMAAGEGDLGTQALLAYCRRQAIERS